MKRILQLIVLSGIAFSLNSCGLPGALVRSAGNAVNSASALVGSAAGS